MFTHCLIVLSACAYIQGLYRHGTRNIHELMTVPELGFYFGISNQNDVPEYQIVYMPVLLQKSAQTYGNDSDEDETIDYGFNAFGRRVDLHLKPNKNLLAPNFAVHRRDSSESDAEILDFDTDTNCHYLHKQDESVAAISMCQKEIIHGLVFMDNDTYEIRPLTPRLKSFVELENVFDIEDEQIEGIPHLVRRATVDKMDLINDFRLPAEDYYENSIQNDEEDLSRMKRYGSYSGYTVEVAVFFDEAAYSIFAPYLNYNENEIRDMLLAYMNGVQALYHHPSIGTPLELTLVRLELMKKQPAAMPHYNGERSQLLDSFCDYQKRLNPPGDSNPDHWDMGLYVSGLDFYAIENGRKSGVTMGLATVGGVCYDQYACVIAELGTTNVFGKPYPSAGFTSVYIMAHEIGHNLGMHHDSSGNSCTKEGYIMSPSRGTVGETIWSPCSANVMSRLGSSKCLLDKPKGKPDLNHARYQDAPGQTWGAKRQCEFLLRDKDAYVSLAGSSLSGICQQLQCKTPHRSGFYFAGPALEGTDCGKGLWCHGGQCMKMEKKKPSIVQGGWSDWKYGECNSGCIAKSMGFLTKRRTCDNPKPVNTEEGCEGNSFEINICKDKKICSKKKRISVTDYSSNKCKEFSKWLPELDPKGSGLQAPHEESRLWMACAIFCRRTDTGSYYTPRIDLNDLGIDPYFPDGTWCHYNEKENYYCLQHHCLPESFKFSKLWGTLGEDISLPGNAHPRPITLPPIIQKYLSLGVDGKPLLTTLEPGQNLHPPDDDWTDHDYLDLPRSVTRLSDEE